MKVNMSNFGLSAKSATQVEVTKPVEIAASPAPSPDSPVPAPGQRRIAAAHFLRAIVFCEVIADLLTITLAVVLGYFIYDSLRLGRHIYYPIGTVLALAFAFSIVMVLMSAAFMSHLFAYALYEAGFDRQFGGRQ